MSTCSERLDCINIKNKFGLLLKTIQAFKMVKDAKRQKQDLLESDSDSEDSRNSGNSSNNSTENSKPTLQVNESYAKDFNQRKRKEELNKHKKSIQWDEAVKQYTIENEVSDDDESVSSSEDEYAERLTPKVDLKILQTINAIRRGEEKVYNPQVKFFTEEDDYQSEEEETQPTKPKKKRFKDVLREQILEQINSDDDDQALPIENSDVVEIHHLEYDEEQRNLRKDLIKSIHNSENEEEDDDLLVNKPSKTTDMDEDAQEAIKNELDDLLQNSDKSLLDPKGEVKDGEAFLRDFILQRKWVDKDVEADDDIDGVDSQAKRKVKIIGGNNADEDSLEELDRMEEFESKYNFRFEEQGDDKVQIVSYARGGTGDTFRRPEDTRKKKRQERKERKAAERKAKEEQLRRLKNARREELQEQLNQIKAVSGMVDDSSKTLDEETLAKLMEGDFDPDKFSSVMEELYGEGFYQKEEEQWKSEADVKQSMQTAKELGEGLVDDFYDEGEDEEHEEEQQEQLIQDEEQYYDEQLEEEAPIPETQLERKLKKKMEEELYKLDYEDIVAGMPCRFKYKKVEPNSFGLTCEEILFAKDSTLKQFVSLKKMTPYREGVSATTKLVYMALKQHGLITECNFSLHTARVSSAC